MKKTIGIFLGAGLAYLAALAPGRRKKAQGLSGGFYAHRGLHQNQGDGPENTLLAFRRAVEAGYGIELDIQLSRDGQVVAAHDLDLKRICQEEKNIDELTYEELKQYRVFGSEEKIPLLKEVLELVDGRVPLIVELKYKRGSGLCQKAQEILKNYRGEYCVESFHPQVLYWYKKHAPEVLRGQLSMNYRKEKGWRGPQYRIMSLLLTNFLTKPDFIAYDWRAGKNLSLQLCRKLFGCPAYAWTIKDRESLEKARGLFDGYIFEGFLPGEKDRAESEGFS